MDGKRVIVIVIIVSLLGLIISWVWGQSLIEKYDLERALPTIEYVKSTYNFSPNINYFL